MKNVLWTKTLVRMTAMLAMILAATGCLQLELAIEMHEEDGGATLTERLRFSEVLLDLDRGTVLARHLGRTGAQSRMKHMGQGISLKSHAENRLPDGSRESVAVYHIPNIEDLRLPNPFLQNNPPGPAYRIEIRPDYGRFAGSLGVRMVRAGSAGSSGFDDTDAIPVETPLDLQLYRDLQPMFADMMKDFEVKISLTVPRQPGTHGRQAGDRTLTLLYFNDRHMDRHSEPFVRNEEAMLALLQFKMAHEDIVKHTVNFPRNRQVPIHRGRRHPYHSDSFRIRPTRHLFRKHFAGRPKSEGGDQ